MKGLIALMCLLLASVGSAGEGDIALNAEQIRAKIAQVNDAHNTMMKAGSVAADVEALFALYSDDFVYVHLGYGGTYSRAELYNNSIKNQAAGRYRLSRERYTIVNIIAGLNAAAVERLELDSGKHHLSVFEFNGEKVSKITEYWK